jgi:hypothetical protein
MRYIRGHARGAHHDLTEINEEHRTARCSRCGEITVKRDGDRWKCTTRLQARHRISSIDPDARTAWCGACGQVVDIVRHKRGGERQGKDWLCGPESRRRAQEYKDANRERIREGHKTWRAQNRRQLQNAHLVRTYGITIQDYERMLVLQGGHCALCPATRGNARSELLFVDHDKETGLIRDWLLCGSCNIGIGCLGHDPVRLRLAADYLEDVQQRAVHALV